MTTIIDVHSYKGGTGVTTVSCALALHLAENGSKVFLADTVNPASSFAWLGVPPVARGKVKKIRKNLSLRALALGEESPDYEPVRLSDFDYVVFDNGKNATADYGGILEVVRICVVRNDYLTLSNTVGKFNNETDGLIVMQSDTATLTTSDVQSVLGKEPIVVKLSEKVQRTIDAGLTQERSEMFSAWFEELSFGSPAVAAESE